MMKDWIRALFSLDTIGIAIPILALVVLSLVLSHKLASASGTTVISDTFTRSVSSGWGSADTGGAYTLTGTASDFNVDGSAGTMNAPSLSTSRTALLGSVSNQDTDITFRFNTNKLATGISQEVFFIARQVSTNTAYRGKIRLTPSGTVTVQAEKLIAGVETFLGAQTTVTGLSYSAGSYLRVHSTVTGTNPTTISISVWADGNSEPGSFTYTTTDSDSNLQTSGNYGLRVNLPSATSNAPVLFSFDDYIVTSTDPTPTPSPTASPQTGFTLLTDTFTRTVSNGWGTSDNGKDYVIVSGSASDFSVSGTEGKINSPTSALTRAIVLNSTSQQDVDIKFQAKIDKVPTGTAAEIFWIARRVDPSNYYRGKIRFTGSTSITVQAAKVVGGTETLLGAQTTTGVNLAADTYVWVRAQITGTNPTTINIKVWAAGDTEPIAYQYTTTDSESALQASGSIGFRTNIPSAVSNAPLLVTFDNVNATTQDAGIVTPTAPPQSGTTLATDTFTRTTSNGWGTADTGGAWTISTGASSNFSTDGSTGSMVAIAGASRSLFLGGISQEDYDIQFKVKASSIPTGTAAEAFWVARRLDPNNQYRGKIRFTTSGTITVQASNVVGGVETLLGTQASTGTTFTAGSYVWVRSQIIGTSPTTIYMKAWADGSTEPVTWQYIQTDYQVSALQGSGSVGLRINIPASVSNGPLTFTFDSLNVTTDDLTIFDASTAATPTPTPLPPSDVTASVNLSGSPTVSKLHIGVTHTQESINSGGDATAINAGKALLSTVAQYENQHIMGFGANNLWDDPSTDPVNWNWSSLDTRVKLMRDTGSVPILTLFGAPTWMVDPTWYSGKYNGSNTDWGQLTLAPLDVYESDFAYMVGQIVSRYNGTTLDDTGTPFPKIEYFQVWNEMKGFWDRSVNHWNYDKYNRMYGLVYDEIKSLRPEANVGGPYVRFSKYVYPHAAQNSSLTSTAYGTVDQRDMNVVTQWLTWLTNNLDTDGHLKAQFIAVDGNITPKDVLDGTFPPNLFAALQQYSDIDDWMNTQMSTIINTTLPIWWSEDYVGKVNGDPVLITSETLQPPALATMLSHHVNSGTNTSLRWGPEEQVSSQGVAQGDKQNLFSSTQFAGGGQAFTNYYVYSYFRNYFSSGTSVYPVTIAPSTNAISVLASSSKALIINTSSIPINVTISSSVADNTYSTAAYEVKLVDMPTPAPTASPTSTATATPTATPTASPTSTPTSPPIAGETPLPSPGEIIPSPLPTPEPIPVANGIIDLVNTILSGNELPRLAVIEQLIKNSAIVGDIVNSPLVRSASEIIPAAGLVIPPVVLVALAAASVSPATGGIFFPLVQLLIRILQAIGLLPVRKPEGITFDTQSGSAIPFANITVHRFGDEETTDRVITDEYGVYQGVKFPAGKYSIEALHSDYSFPTTKPRFSLTSLSNFYKGEKFAITQEAKEQFFVIPMDPKFATLRTASINRVRTLPLFISGILRLLFYPLAIISIIMPLFFPSFINFVIAFAYISLFVVSKLGVYAEPVLSGTIKDALGVPIPGVVLRFIEAGTNNLRAIRVSGADGSFSVPLKKGNYSILPTKQSFTATQEGNPSDFVYFEQTRAPESLDIKMTPVSQFA
ncbi:MAG TPA: carboxypeptidase-like regulatory domain-containing protein [Patescibacteria group bacterium]|nr:carboxypeptidase-like regulatory domain-containing protein [Patescibacteria group bacterium]